MDNGFIKLHRSLTKWEWYKDQNTFKLWLHLLLTANWKDGRFEGHEVPAGSLVTSIKHLSQETGLSQKNVRTALEHLKTTNEVAIKTTNKFTLITVEKWAFYQGGEGENGTQSGNQNGKQLANNWQTTGKQLATIEEYKEIQEIKENNKSINTPELTELGSLVVSDRLQQKLSKMTPQPSTLVISDRLRNTIRSFYE